MKTALWICTAIFVITTTCGSAAERPTAVELLTAYQHSVEQLSRVIIECDEVMIETKDGDNKSAGEPNKSTIIHDAHRWKVDETREAKSFGNPSKQSVRTQTLIGDEIISATVYTASPGDRPPPPIVSAYRDDSPKRIWSLIGPSRVVFGRMAGDAGQPIWSIMNDAATLELLPQRETIAGAETYVVRSQGKYGEHKIWLDPESGGLPWQIEVRKQVGNLLNDEQLGTRPAQEAQAQPDPPPLPPRREFAERIDNIRIEHKSGIWVITGFDYEVSITYANEKKRNLKKQYRIREIDIDPKSLPENAFRFDIAIPNGTRVAFFENAPLEFQGRVEDVREWVDGKIQKRSGQ